MIETITATAKDPEKKEQREINANFDVPGTVQSFLANYGEDVCANALKAWLRTQIQTVIRRTITAGRHNEAQKFVDNWKPGSANKVPKNPVLAFQQQLKKMDPSQAAELLNKISAGVSNGGA